MRHSVYWPAMDTNEPTSFAVSFSNTVDRRAWLASAAGVTGAAFWADVSAAQENPARQVEDRGSNLKIKSLRGFRVGTKAYIRIETNHGFTGWGEVTGLEPEVAVTLGQSLFELIDGENPTRI